MSLASSPGIISRRSSKTLCSRRSLCRISNIEIYYNLNSILLDCKIFLGVISKFPIAKNTLGNECVHGAEGMNSPTKMAA